MCEWFDYDQVNNVKLEPVLVSNLAILMSANQFVTGGRACFFWCNYKHIYWKIFTDKLRKVDLFFEVSNTINRGYTDWFSFFR
jgi:hypothetical protein